jgi:hypothetical protein
VQGQAVGDGLLVVADADGEGALAIPRLDRPRATWMRTSVSRGVRPGSARVPRRVRTGPAVADPASGSGVAGRARTRAGSSITPEGGLALGAGPSQVGEALAPGQAELQGERSAAAGSPQAVVSAPW